MLMPPSTLEHLSAARLLPRPSSLQRWRPLRDWPRCIFCAAASKSDAFRNKARAASVHMAAFCILPLRPGQSLPHASARVGGQPPLPNKTVSPNRLQHIPLLHPGRPPTGCAAKLSWEDGARRKSRRCDSTDSQSGAGARARGSLSLISTVVLSPRRRPTRAR